jgi:aryl-alcohol dehydrogenase-like predicted oxidoreductase
VIPGARTPEQARGNAAAADVPALDGRTLSRLESIYDEMIRPYVHERW